MKKMAARGRRASESINPRKISQKHYSTGEKEEEEEEQDDNVGVPASMISKKKNERQFNVLRNDQNAVNPFQQIFEAIKHNNGTKELIRTELETFKSGMAGQVDLLQSDFSEKVKDISERLESVEKYMFRQNIISKMRENEARKKRQQRVKSPDSK